MRFNSGADLFWRFRLIASILRQAQEACRQAVILSLSKGAS